MNEIKEKNSLNFWFITIPLIFILFPTPFNNAQFLTYPLLGAVIVWLILKNRIFWNFYLSSKLIFILILMIFLSMLICLSILINIENIQISSLVHILKPIFFSLILIITYLLVAKSNYVTITSSLLRLVYLLLIFETFVSLLQLLDINILSNIYSDKKSEGFGGKLRIVGTLGNPNIFAWIISQIAVIMLLFEKRKGIKIVAIGIAIILIVLTGSRSFTILTPLFLLISYLLIQKINFKFVFVILPLSFIFLVSFFKLFIWFIYKYQDLFPYLSQLTNIFETGNLRSINSFDLRIGIWQDGLERLGDSWLFGVGPGVISTMDNDYLFAYVNYGIVYTVFQLIVYIIIGLLFIMSKSIKLKILGIQSLILTFVVSFQADTISGWSYPFLILFYTGVLLGLEVSDDKILKKV